MHLQVLAGQFPEVRQQCRIAAVECLVQPVRAPSASSLARTRQISVAADQIDPLEPFQGQVAPEETGRPGQQHGAHLRARARQRRGGGECLRVDELVQLEIAGVHLGGLAAVHRRKAVASLASLPNCWLKLLTDGASNRVRTARSLFSAVLIAAITRIADSESPPRSKNDSSTPTRSSPSTWA